MSGLDLHFLYFKKKKNKQRRRVKLSTRSNLLFFFFIIKYIIKQLCVPETRIGMRKNIRLLLTLHASFIDATRVFY